MRAATDAPFPTTRGIDGNPAGRIAPTPNSFPMGSETNQSWRRCAMAAPDKRDSRELRDLKQQGQAALTWGLANPVTEATVVGVALLVRDKLADKTAAGSAAAATDIATRMLDKSTAKLAAAGTFACTKGCNYCCHSVVSVSAPEVFRIANALTAAGGDVAGQKVGRLCRALQPLRAECFHRRSGAID